MAVRETDLRDFARALAPRLMRRMKEEGEGNEAFRTQEDRMRFLLGQEETEALRAKLRAAEKEEWPQKNLEVARRNREDGNAAFQSGDFSLALLLYSESMRYAPVDPRTLQGEELALLAANRSAALFQLGRFRQCLEDTELALEAGYADGGHATHKLYVR